MKYQITITREVAPGGNHETVVLQNFDELDVAAAMVALNQQRMPTVKGSLTIGSDSVSGIKWGDQ